MADELSGALDIWCGAWLDRHAQLANRFEYRIDIGWWVFGGTGAVTIGIAWLTIGLQAIRAARANPVKTLRAE